MLQGSIRSKLAYFKESAFIRNFFAYMSGGVIAKAIGLVTFIYIGKLLSPEKYAEFAIFLMTVELLSVFVNVGIQSGMMRITWDDKSVILSNALLIITILTAFMTMIIFSFSDFVIYSLNPIYTFLTEYKIWISIRIFSVTLIGVLSSFYVSIERPVKFVKVNIVASAINLVLLVFLTTSNTFLKNIDILWLIIMVNTLAGLFSMAYGLYISKNYLNISTISIQTSLSIIKQTFVFLLKSLIGFFQMYASRIVLSLIATSYLLGVYSFYSNILIQLSFLTSIFDKTYIPKIRNLVLDKDLNKNKLGHRLVRKTVKYYTIYSTGIFLIMGLIVYFIIKYRAHFDGFIQEGYLKYLHLFYFMFFAWLVGNIRSFFEVWQYTQNKQINKHIIFIHIIILFLLYFGSVFFFNLFGIYGIIINQILIYLFYLKYSLSCYNKYVLRPVVI
jgi:O-antigen/teichoic acid export membrane protein